MFFSSECRSGRLSSESRVDESLEDKLIGEVNVERDRLEPFRKQGLWAVRSEKLNTSLDIRKTVEDYAAPESDLLWNACFEGQFEKKNLTIDSNHPSREVWLVDEEVVEDKSEEADADGEGGRLEFLEDRNNDEGNGNSQKQVDAEMNRWQLIGFQAGYQKSGTRTASGCTGMWLWRMIRRATRLKMRWAQNPNIT